jgi:hypothetical protein
MAFMTKYTDLQQKVDQNDQQFDNYEKECRQFVTDLRSALIKYLDCPDDRIQWLTFSRDEPSETRESKGVIELTLDNRMALYQDAFYGFLLRLKFYDPKRVVAGGKYVDLKLRVKKKGPNFIVRAGKNEKITTQDKLSELVEYIASELEKSLDTEFHTFLEGEKPEMGFLSFAKSNGEE